MRSITAFCAVSLLLATPMVFAAEETVIAAKTEHREDVKLGHANLRVEDGAAVYGNIFIEEGDLFIGEEVDINGSITIKKGNIFIKSVVDIARNVIVERGNITMKNKNKLHGDIICKNGVVKGGTNNTIYGDVYAQGFTMGRNSDVKGFIK